MIFVVSACAFHFLPGFARCGQLLGQSRESGCPASGTPKVLGRKGIITPVVAATCRSISECHWRDPPACPATRGVIRAQLWPDQLKRDDSVAPVHWQP